MHPDSSQPLFFLFCFPAPGEKLDYKACEALEEIFKRVQFKIVDLEQTSLDEDVSGRVSAGSSVPIPQNHKNFLGFLALSGL